MKTLCVSGGIFPLPHRSVSLQSHVKSSFTSACLQPAVSPWWWGIPTKTPSAPPFPSKPTPTPTNSSTGSEQRENEWEWGFPMNTALDVWKGILRTCCITSWQEMETWNTGIRSTCGMCMWSTKGFGKILFHTNQDTYAHTLAER